MTRKLTFAPAHAGCVGVTIKSKIGGGRRLSGPDVVMDADGHSWNINVDAPKYGGACPLCRRTVNVARHWEAILLSR